MVCGIQIQLNLFMVGYNLCVKYASNYQRKMPMKRMKIHISQWKLLQPLEPHDLKIGQRQ